MRTRTICAVAVLATAGCASTPPTPIGGDTYYAAKTNTAGAFGDPTTVAGKLMAEGGQFCSSKGREFELVTETVTPSRPGAGLGGASITFKCVDHASNPVMRPDKGVTTVTNQ